MASDSRVRARKRVLCPHCKESVSHATYYRHRERFYDPQNDQWTRGLERHVAGATTSGDCNSSSSDEIDDLSTHSESPLQSLEGLHDDSFEEHDISYELCDVTGGSGQLYVNNSSSNGSDQDINSVSCSLGLICSYRLGFYCFF